MERSSNRIAQLYGYSVCLVAVLVFTFALLGFAQGLFALTHVTQQLGSEYGQSLTSFEAYKASSGMPAVNQNVVTLSHPGSAAGTATATRMPSASAPAGQSDAELRARYESLRADRIASATNGAVRDVFLSGLMLVFAIVLFWLHWRWLKTLAPA